MHHSWFWDELFMDEPLLDLFRGLNKLGNYQEASSEEDGNQTRTFGHYVNSLTDKW